ncbi:hypothetical protein TNCV_2304871 [Trichonephila clavipes]|nr:hypothetical protein TNCV_2304871 [Trichonephila clavipes]
MHAAQQKKRLGTPALECRFLSKFINWTNLRSLILWGPLDRVSGIALPHHRSEVQIPGWVLVNAVITKFLSGSPVDRNRLLPIFVADNLGNQDYYSKLNLTIRSR